MEVMGLMLGEFVDDFTVRVVDVFAMPQSGTGVSVEAVDPVFQTKMMDMLRQTGRYGTIAVLLFVQSTNHVPEIETKLLLAGIIRILDLAAGSRPSISTHSNLSNN